MAPSLLEMTAELEDELDLGFSRLTPQELRILVLSADASVDLDALAAQLGVARSTVAAQRTSIRGKLGIPPFEQFFEFLNRTPHLACLLQAAPEARRCTPASATCAEVQDDVRAKHVLRTAIQEVEALGARLKTNVLGMHALAEVVRPEQVDSLLEEANSVGELANRLLLLAESAIESARR